LESIEWVDEVHVFHNTVGLELLVKNINPDIMVVGSDWRGKPIVGSQYTKEVKYFDRIDGYSTTQIIKNIINR
jgi:D-beta-D-heptose 7-phosphate kinase/D-beta-D-heptose 1-phosphate adenosyltransferase